MKQLLPRPTKKEIGQAFGFDALARRLIAAFCGASVLPLLVRRGDWSQKVFTASVPLWLPLTAGIAVFLVLSLLSLFHPDSEADSLGLFALGICLFGVALTSCATPWLYAVFCLCGAVLLFCAWPSLCRLGGRLSAPLAADRHLRHLPLALSVFALCCACTVLAVGTVYKVKTHSYATFDFGIFAQMFENMRKTGLPMTTVERNRPLSHFAVHFSPIFYLWLPFYMLCPRPETLQVLQALTVFSAAVPLWRLSRRRGLSGTVSAGLLLLLALYPAFTTGCLYSVHENKFLLPLLLWLFDAVERRTVPGIAVSALLVLSVKEDAFVYLFFLGLFLLLRAARERRLREAVCGASLLCGGLVWFFAVSALMKAQGEGVMTWRYANFDYLGTGSLFTVVKSVFLNPLQVFSEAFRAGKIPFVLFTLLPLAPLCFCGRRWERLVLFGPYLLVNLMADWTYQQSVYFQYHYGSCAFLFYLAVLDLSDVYAMSAASAAPSADGGDTAAAKVEKEHADKASARAEDAAVTVVFTEKDGTDAVSAVGTDAAADLSATAENATAENRIARPDAPDLCKTPFVFSKKKQVSAFLLCLSLLCGLFGYAALVRDGGGDTVWQDNPYVYVDYYRQNGQNEKEIDRLLAMIPDDATVGASTYYTTALSRCAALYDLSAVYPIPEEVTFDWVAVNLRSDRKEWGLYADSPDWEEVGRLEGYLAVYRRR